MPEYIEMVTRWVKAATRMPVIVKLTPNITAVRHVTDWRYLNLNYVAKAQIDQQLCIKCGRCYAACEDTSHQAIAIRDKRVIEVIDEECVACNLCVIACPVQDCITMETVPVGAVDARTGKTVEASATGRRIRTTPSPAALGVRDPDARRPPRAATANTGMA